MIDDSQANRNVAYSRGFADAMKGIVCNPYPEASPEGEQWSEGFSDGTEEYIRSSYGDDASSGEQRSEGGEG